MLENAFTFPLVILYAILYGITMKIADLLDEHGLKWFRGSNFLFGVLWGVFGALLILSNETLANIILAMNIAFLMRGRLDYLNHQIGASIVLISFLAFSVFNPIVFLAFWIIFVVFGSVKDYMDEESRNRGTVFILTESMLYYPVPALIYCLFYGDWIIFWGLLVYTISYNATKYIYAKKRGESV